MDGLSILILRLAHSSIKFTTLSVLSISDDNTAAINEEG
jgi:hypothetical protein